MSDTPQSEDSLASDEAQRGLRFLRRLVTILTATMIVGVIVIVALLVIRLNQTPRPLALPAQLALPEGTNVIAVTQTVDNILVVTEAESLLIFDASGTELLGAIQVGDFIGGAE